MKQIAKMAFTAIARFIKKRVLRQPLRSEQISSSYIGPGGLPVIVDAEYEEVVR